MIETNCTPCVKPEPFVPQQISVPCEPCKVEEPKSPLVLPTRRRVTVETDCFQSMLLNMTTQFFCGEGPRAC
ncbi:hypothetical protein FDI24_gp074 [Acidovorax phage ACP17]|uniref:Uncharacterized protein n=1 Tax=Acidovorax phage ACP17 TaxID=2010329 RepID=A0A223AIZ5_9CAUD|nr:hypothetical protein FDI24_gp074 [Acidovorax phage ACP17]ASS33936.1 hypothetical protein [Acidovorax phage ACP17]